MSGFTLKPTPFSIMASNRDTPDSAERYWYGPLDGHALPYHYPVPYPGPVWPPSVMQPTQSSAYSSKMIQTPPYYAYYPAVPPEGTAHAGKSRSRGRRKKRAPSQQPASTTPSSPELSERGGNPPTRLSAKKPVQLERWLVFAGRQYIDSIGIPASQLSTQHPSTEDEGGGDRAGRKPQHVAETQSKSPALEAGDGEEADGDARSRQSKEDDRDDEGFTTALEEAEPESARQEGKESGLESGPPATPSQENSDKLLELELHRDTSSITPASSGQVTVREEAGVVQDASSVSARGEPEGQGQSKPTKPLSVEDVQTDLDHGYGDDAIILLKLYRPRDRKSGEVASSEEQSGEAAPVGDDAGAQPKKEVLSIGVREGKYFVELS